MAEANKIKIKDASASYKSAVWKSFGFLIDDVTGVLKKDTTICKLCFTKLKYTGNTTNMTFHLKRHHPSLTAYGSNETKATNKTVRAISDCFAAQYSINSSKSQTITRQIGIFLAADYSLVDTPAFSRMVQTLDPKYKIPSRTFFAETVIPDLYQSTEQEVRERINAAEGMAITTDGWTSRATESFLTITAHFISDGWTLENVVLQTRPLHESHTGLNIANVSLEAKEE